MDTSPILRYKYTLLFAALILIITIPYNYLIQPTAPCVPNLYAMLTSPFNIGCETNIATVGTAWGFYQFINNFVFPLIVVALMEKATEKKEDNYRMMVFFMALVATYLAEATSILAIHQPAAGTSIVGISILIFLVYWYLADAIAHLKDRNLIQYARAGVITIIIICLAVGAYEEGWTLHLVGGMYFVTLMLLTHFWQNWVKKS